MLLCWYPIDIIGKIQMRRLNLWGVPKLVMKILVCPLFFSEIWLVVPYHVSLINVIECICRALATSVGVGQGREARDPPGIPRMDRTSLWKTFSSIKGAIWGRFKFHSLGDWMLLSFLQFILVSMYNDWKVSHVMLATKYCSSLLLN